MQTPIIFSLHKNFLFKHANVLRIGVSLLLLLSFNLQAQDYVKSYLFLHDVQHYTPIPVAGVDEHALAGTIGNREAHFLRVDASGTILASKKYSDNELHVVSMVQPDDNSGDFIITCLFRSLPGVTPAQDGIKILRVNSSGGVVSNQNIFCDLSTNPYTDMYPLHSIYYGESLYICGYTTANTAYPNSPDYTHDKKAFVIRWDPATLGVVASITLNSDFSPSPTLTEDYDIPMRMKVNNAGELYVTGSCNVVSGPATTPPTPLFRSGILSITLNASTLNKISEAPIASMNGKHTYGVDMIELPNSLGSFVLGNDFSPSTTLGWGGYTNPEHMNITYIGVSLNVFDFLITPGFPDSRMSFTNWAFAWGLNFLPSMDGPDNAIVAGFSTHWGNCMFNNYPSMDNITAHLADFTLSGNVGTGFITYNNNYWKFYETLGGTGSTTLANSYHNYGGHISNNGWLPCIATRRALGSFTNDDIALYSPWWAGNTTSGQLSMKITRADLVGDLPTCPTDVNCPNIVLAGEGVYISQYPSGPVIPIYTHISNPGTSILHPVVVTDAEIVVDDYEMIDALDCVDNNVWKKTNIEKNQDDVERTFAFYPNPASNQLTIETKSPGREDIRIFLTDITGNEIGTLFQGKPNPKISVELPLLSAGLYILHIQEKGKIHHVQKLIIK